MLGFHNLQFLSALVNVLVLIDLHRSNRGHHCRKNTLWNFALISQYSFAFLVNISANTCWVVGVCVSRCDSTIDAYDPFGNNPAHSHGYIRRGTEIPWHFPIITRKSLVFYFVVAQSLLVRLVNHIPSKSYK